MTYQSKALGYFKAIEKCQALQAHYDACQVLANKLRSGFRYAPNDHLPPAELENLQNASLILCRFYGYDTTPESLEAALNELETQLNKAKANLHTKFVSFKKLLYKMGDEGNSKIVYDGYMPGAGFVDNLTKLHEILLTPPADGMRDASRLSYFRAQISARVPCSEEDFPWLGTLEEEYRRIGLAAFSNLVAR